MTPPNNELMSPSALATQVIELRADVRHLTQEVARLAIAVEHQSSQLHGKIHSLEIADASRRGERGVISTISGAAGALLTIILTWALNRHGG